MTGSSLTSHSVVSRFFSLALGAATLLFVSESALAINRPSFRDQSLLQEQTKKFYDSNLVSMPQTGGKKTAPAPTPTPKPEVKHYFNYFAEFAGPSADFALPLESYSPYGDDYVPLNLYQSIDYAQKFDNSKSRIGIVLSTIWNFDNESIDKSGNIHTHSRKLTFFDPTIYYQFYDLINNSFSWMNGKVSFDIPVSDFSRQVGYQTGLYNSYTWNFRMGNPNIYFNLNFDAWMFFYNPQPGWNKFQFAIGHEWGYVFNPTWTLHTSSVFDMAYRERYEFDGGGYQYSPNNVDRFRVTLRCNIVPNTFQIGAFVQSPLYDPALERVMMGLNTNVWF